MRCVYLGGLQAFALIALLLLGTGRAGADIRADFNGDGFEDLAIGAPGEGLPDGAGGTINGAGAVNVLYGSKKGLAAKRNQFWHQDRPGVKDTVEPADPVFGGGDGFGTALAAGDFDGDGFDDLAVGAPNEGLPDGAGGTLKFAGAVNVLYGSKKGLTEKGDQFWHQNSPGVEDTAEGGDPMFGPGGDAFGAALAAGDFDGDGFDDLAIGVPAESLPDGAGGTLEGAGAVNVLYGSKKGLTAKGDQLWHQNSPGVKGTAEGGDPMFGGVGGVFGSALAAGDFNDDGRDDLAIGARFADLPDGAGGTLSNAGTVNVLYGSGKGLRSKKDQLWHQDSAGVEDDAEAIDLFGGTLVAGDFNGDGFCDLAIGVTAEDLPDGAGGSHQDAGAVNLLLGSAKGLTAKGDQFWHQDSRGVRGAANQFDTFGGALAAGDFDNDGRDDLAIGVGLEDLSDGAGGTIANAGALHVLHGSGKGLTAKGDQFWHQNSPGVEDDAEASDFFAFSLMAGDFNGDGRDDLAVGVRGEDLPDGAGGTVSDAGAVNVLFGRGKGLRAKGNQFWHQNSPRVKDSAEQADFFGAAMP